MAEDDAGKANLAQEIFEEWYARCERGEGESFAELVEAHPDQHEELRRRLEQKQSVLDAMRASLEAGAGAEAAAAQPGPEQPGEPGAPEDAGEEVTDDGDPTLLAPGGRVGHYHLLRAVGGGGGGCRSAS